MNNTYKKIAAAMLALTIIGVAAPSVGGMDIFTPAVTANAAQEGSASFDAQTGILTLSGNITEEVLTDYRYKSNVTKVIADETTVLPEDCNNMFAFYTAESIDLSKADASHVKDMNEMFTSCKATSINLKNLDTSNVTNMDSMFDLCSDLKNLDISGINTSKVTNMSQMFRNTALTSLDLKHFDTSSLYYMSEMFGGSSKLTSIDLSGWKNTGLVEMSEVFKGCSALENINLTNFKTPKVRFMSSLFSGCSSLESLDLSSFDTQNVENMYNMFTGCIKLASLDISSFNTSKVTNMKGMFLSCGSLETLNHNGFDISNAQDLDQMFLGCSKLTNLDLSSFTKPKATSMSYVFNGCTGLTSIDLSNLDTSDLTSMSSAFVGCSSLPYFDMSNINVEKLEDKNYYALFSGCTALNSCVNRIKGTSISLDGTIGVNYYVQLGGNTKKVVLNGPTGDVVITDLASHKQSDGSYKFTYSIRSTELSDKTSIQFFDDQDRPLIVTNSNYLLQSYAKAEYSVRDYIADTAKYSDDEKLSALVAALDNYGYAAENYFNGTSHAVNGISGVTKESLSGYAPTISDSIKFSLVLNSDTAVRVYTESNNFKVGTANGVSGTKNGKKFYAITNIPAHKLSTAIDISIDGTAYSLNPMSYVYRVLNNTSASPELTAVAKAVFVYADAAKNYIG